MAMLAMDEQMQMMNIEERRTIAEPADGSVSDYDHGPPIFSQIGPNPREWVGS